MKQPRFEVVITTYHQLDAVCGGPRVNVEQFRYRWRARLRCWVVNNIPGPHPLLFGVQSAKLRPILRLVPMRAAA